MDRNRDGGEGWMVRGWHALTFVVECEVLALTLGPADSFDLKRKVF